jgi:hypothetical protein
MCAIRLYSKFTFDSPERYLRTAYPAFQSNNRGNIATEWNKIINSPVFSTILAMNAYEFGVA